MGAPVFDAGRRAFPLFVKANNLDSSKIKWQSMDPPLRETMLVARRGGRDHRVLLHEPAQSQRPRGEGRGRDVLKYPEYGVDLYSNTVIANQKFIDSEATGDRGVPARAHEGHPRGGRRPGRRDPVREGARPADRRGAREAPHQARDRHGDRDAAFKSNGVGARERAEARGHGDAGGAARSASRATPKPDTIFNASFLPSSGGAAGCSRSSARADCLPAAGPPPARRGRRMAEAFVDFDDGSISPTTSRAATRSRTSRCGSRRASSSPSSVPRAAANRRS